MLKRIAKYAVTAALIGVIAAGLGAFNYGVQRTAYAQSYYSGSQASLFPNYRYPAVTFTAVGTSTPIAIGGVSAGTIQLLGTSLTTVTWQLKGSNDGGLHYYPILVQPIGAYPATTPPVSTAITSTASGLYTANLSGLTNLEIVTSGTFTATSVAFNVTASSNKALF